MTAQTRHHHIPLLPLLLACVGGILLGFSPIFVRFSDLGPMTTGFYRMLLALPFLWIWMLWEEQRVDQQKRRTCSTKDYLVMFLGGGFFALDLALWNWSLDYTAIVNATLFNNTAAFFVPLLMWLIFSEKQSLRFVMAAIAGFSGCILLAGDSLTISTQHVIGDLVSLGSGVMVALYVITIKRIRNTIHTGSLMFWTGLASLVGMGLFGLLFGESFWPLTSHDWLSIFGLAILVHVTGQGLLAYAMGKIPASYGALIMLLAPVTAAILGWFIYGEGLSSLKLVGILVIMASIFAVRGRRDKGSTELV